MGGWSSGGWGRGVGVEGSGELELGGLGQGSWGWVRRVGVGSGESTLDLLQKNSKSRVDSLAFNIDAKTKIKLLIAGFGLRITLKF